MDGHIDASLDHQSHGGGLSWLNQGNKWVQTIPRPGTTSDWITLPSYMLYVYMLYVYKMCKNLFIHLFIHSFIHSFIRLSVRSFVCSFVRLCLFGTSSFISFVSFVSPFVHLFIRSFDHPFVCLFVCLFVR